jgi:predicted metal-binding protein
MPDERLSELVAFAMSLGISDARVLGVDEIRVEDRFRTYCGEPRCTNYNTSINCPPHSMTPAQFRDHIKSFRLVLAFKFDMPAEAVHGTGLREASLLLHETTAAIEHQSKTLGFERAGGFSSGGCKQTLCFEYEDCAALQVGGQCRHSDKARPSLSGMGVNWYELSQALGWVMRKPENEDLNERAETITMGGLVFLD